MRAGAASSRWNPSRRDARDHFRRHAAPRERFADAKQSPGARDRREHGVGIERLDAAQIDHFDLDAVGAELLRDGERFVHHRAVGHDAEIAARPNDSRFPDRQFLRRERVGLEMVIKIFVLAVDDRVVDRDRVDQHRVGVFDRRGRDDDQPGIMRVDRFHALAVEWAAAFRSAGRQAHGDRAGDLGAPILCAGVVENLVERDAGEIRELHLDDRPHSFHGRADRRADHGVFADRRVQDAPGKLFRQTFRGFERATEFPGDVLTVDEDALVFAQKIRLRLADRFEVGDAHRKMTNDE